MSFVMLVDSISARRLKTPLYSDLEHLKIRAVVWINIETIIQIDQN